MPREALKGRVAEAVDERLGALVGISRRLHESPETAWRETASSAFLADELAARGFAVERGAAGLPTAFVAEYGAGAFTVGLVAEYDALPGLGHACGHNIIAATAVGAAEALASVAADLGIGIRVLGTPAEEGGGGKIPMLEAGCFDDLAFAMMIHPGPADAVYARPRAVAHFDVSYRGVTSHAGAYPHLGRNAADAFTIAQVGIGLLRQQLAQSVRVHGIVTEAGTAPNAIPEIARGSWYVRADTLAELDGAFARVRACFEAGAMAAGCEWELSETSPRYAEFRNDEQLARLFAANGAALGRDMDLAETGPRGMATASTDMGNVSQRVRAIHPYLGIGSLPAVNHQPAFAAATVTPAGDQAVRDGAVLLAQTAIDAVLAGLFCWSLDQVGCPLAEHPFWLAGARSVQSMLLSLRFGMIGARRQGSPSTRCASCSTSWLPPRRERSPRPPRRYTCPSRPCPPRLPTWRRHSRCNCWCATTPAGSASPRPAGNCLWPAVSSWLRRPTCSAPPRASVTRSPEQSRSGAFPSLPPTCCLSCSRPPPSSSLDCRLRRLR